MGSHKPPVIIKTALQPQALAHWFPAARLQVHSDWEPQTPWGFSHCQASQSSRSTRRDRGPMYSPKSQPQSGRLQVRGQRSGGDEEISQWESLSHTHIHIHGTSFPFRADGAQEALLQPPWVAGGPTHCTVLKKEKKKKAFDRAAPLPSCGLGNEHHKPVLGRACLGRRHNSG